MKCISGTKEINNHNKRCSKYEWKKTDLELSDRIFECKNCDNKIDRDLNVVINIERMGVNILYNRTLRKEVTNSVEAFKTK